MPYTNYTGKKREAVRKREMGEQRRNANALRKKKKGTGSVNSGSIGSGAGGAG